MRYAPLLLVAALGACGQQTGSSTVTTNSETGTVTASTTGNAPTTAAALGMQPGKWETTITTTEVSGTGLGGAARPKPGPMTVSACVTPDQAKKGPGEMLKNAKADCTIKNSTFAGGRIESEANCKMQRGTMSVKSSGTYSPTEVSYDSELALDMGPVHAVTKTHTVSRRVGDCG